MAKVHFTDQFKMPVDFDFDMEVGSVKFGLMMQYRYGYEKRYEKEIRRIRLMLKEAFDDTYYVEKIITKIVLAAERTIPNDFYKCIGVKKESMRI